MLLAMILPGCQTSYSASSSKFHHLAFLMALVSCSSNFLNWPLLALFVVLVLHLGWLSRFKFCHPIVRSLVVGVVTYNLVQCEKQRIMTQFHQNYPPTLSIHHTHITTHQGPCWIIVTRLLMSSYPSLSHLTIITINAIILQLMW